MTTMNIQKYAIEARYTVGMPNMTQIECARREGDVICILTG